jgi:hypothetical protein
VKIRYIEPAENPDGYAEVTVSREEAIRLQRDTVARVRPDFVYESDEQALEDYIVVNWADVINED